MAHWHRNVGTVGERKLAEVGARLNSTDTDGKQITENYPNLPSAEENIPDQPHLERITNIMGSLFQHLYAQSLLTGDH